MISDDLFEDIIEHIFGKIEESIRKSVPKNHGVDYHVLNSGIIQKLRITDGDKLTDKKIDEFYKEFITPRIKIDLNAQVIVQKNTYNLDELLFRRIFLSLDDNTVSVKKPQQDYLIYNTSQQLEIDANLQNLDNYFALENTLLVYQYDVEKSFEDVDVNIISLDVCKLLTNENRFTNFNSSEDDSFFKKIAPALENWTNPLSYSLYNILYQRFRVLYQNFDYIIQNKQYDELLHSESFTPAGIANDVAITNLINSLISNKNSSYEINDKTGFNKFPIVYGCVLSSEITDLMLDAIVLLLVKKLSKVKGGFHEVIDSYIKKVAGSLFINLESYKFIEQTNKRNTELSKYNERTLAYLFWLLKEVEVPLKSLNQRQYVKLVQVFTGYSYKQLEDYFKKVNRQKKMKSTKIKQDKAMIQELLVKLEKLSSFLNLKHL